MKITVKLPDGSIATMDIEEYVKGVVPREMPASWPMEALKAQAVAARSYALATRKHRNRGDPYDVCSTTCCQVYSSARHARSDQAVEETRGIVGIHEGAIAATFFSASCGGHTLGNWAGYLREVTDCPCGAHGLGVSGHQNGLCQYGAMYLATDGKSWQQILDIYYYLDWKENYGNIEQEDPDYAGQIDTLRQQVGVLTNRVLLLEMKQKVNGPFSAEPLTITILVPKEESNEQDGEAAATG
jgi:hypothetical protein